MSQTVTQRFSFDINVLATNTFQVVRFTGDEAISDTFRFDLVVAATDSSLDLAGLVGEAAVFTIANQSTSRPIYGIVSELALIEEASNGVYLYQLVLVPRLERLKLSRQNQIYGTVAPISVMDIVAAEIGETAAQSGVERHGTLGLSSTDFDIRTTASYPTRDYVVQYNETDFAFVSRLLEHWGVFYFFDHSTGVDRVVFGDNNVNFNPIDSNSSIRYAAASINTSAGEESVVMFTAKASQVSTELVLRDYNYRTPKVELLAQQQVDPVGFGWINEYDAHFRTPAEGAILAGVRSEEIMCRKIVYSGKSNCQRMTAGHNFTLADHFRTAWDGDYLIISVHHEGAQPVYGVATIGGAIGPSIIGYQNSFKAIPARTPFRPERVTKEPKISGLMTGRIDGAGEGTRAEIDELGRYKVLLQFDLGGYPAGQASQFIRKAEPYSGMAGGMHFPLLKGTEVLLAHIDGDPDRPIIIGAVPDAASLIVANQDSNVRNRIVTTSGMFIELNDGPGSGGAAAASGGSGLQPQAAAGGTTSGSGSAVNAWQPPASGLYPSGGSGTSLRMGEPTSNGYFRIGAYEPATESGMLPQMMPTRLGGVSSTGQSSIAQSSGGQIASATTTNSSSLSAAPAGAGSASLAPSPAGDATSSSGGASSAPLVATAGSQGALHFAIGDSYEKSTGDSVAETGGNKITQIDGNQWAQVNGNDWKLVEGTATNEYDGNYSSLYKSNYEARTYGNKFQWVAGSSEDIAVGAKTGLFIGNELKTNISLIETFSISGSIKYTLGLEMSTLLGNKTDTIIGAVEKTVTGAQINTYIGDVTSTMTGVSTATNIGLVSKTVTGAQVNMYFGDVGTTLVGASNAVQIGAKTDNRFGAVITVTDPLKCDQQEIKMDITNVSKIENVFTGVGVGTLKTTTVDVAVDSAAIQTKINELTAFV